MSERYQREIEEILKQAGDLPHQGKPRRSGGGLLRTLRGHIGKSLGGRPWVLSPGKVLLLAVVLLVSALVVRSMAPGLLVVFMLWGGLGLFILAYAMFFARSSFTLEKRWRGRLVEDHDTLWSKVKRWLRS